MSNIKVIVKKEIADALSNGTFLLIVAVFMGYMTLISIASGNAYFIESSATGGGYSWWKEVAIIHNIIPVFSFLGAIMAITFGFSSINKERSEGSLKVLLSYPVYRDQIILGKLMAGLLLMAIITLISMSIGVSIYLLITNTFFSVELLERFGAATLLSILLLSGYLGLGILLSIAFKDQKKTLIMAFLFLGIFNSQIFVSFGNLLTNSIYGYEKPYFGSDPWRPGDFINPQARMFQDIVAYLNPAKVYYTMVMDVGQLTGVIFDASGSWQIYPWDFWPTFLGHLSHLAVLIVVPILTYSLSYVLFTRRDIT